MVKSRYIWDGHPTFNDGILIMGPYKPLRTWVDEFIPYYMEIMGVDRPWHNNYPTSTSKLRLSFPLTTWIDEDETILDDFGVLCEFPGEEFILLMAEILH